MFGEALIDDLIDDKKINSPFYKYKIHYTRSTFTKLLKYTIITNKKMKLYKLQIIMITKINYNVYFRFIINHLINRKFIETFPTK